MFRHELVYILKGVLFGHISSTIWVDNANNSGDGADSSETEERVTPVLRHMKKQKPKTSNYWASYLMGCVMLFPIINVVYLY